MDKLLIVLLTLVRFTVESFEDAESEQKTLFLHAPKFIMQQMIDESFDEEIRNLTKGRTARSLLNEVETEECTDNLGTKKCHYLESFGSCYRMDMWASMKSMCKRTCKHCHGNPFSNKGYSCSTSKYGCCPGTREAAKGPNKEGCLDLCYDSYGKDFCKTAKKLGMCQLDKKRLFDGCFKTCGYCRPCKDIVPLKCKVAFKLGACLQLKKTTINYCRQTCNFCGKLDPCFGFQCEENNQCYVAKDGKPKCMCKRKCNVGDEYTGKVCGRDGLEYKSICDLKQAFCKTGSPVYVKRFGTCALQEVLKKLSHCKKAKDIDRCQLFKTVGACKKFPKRMVTLCPHACGYCDKKTFAPKPDCYYTKFGCCLDGVTPCQGPAYEGCPSCTDRFKYLCKRFTPACGSNINKTFMKANCAKRCHYCRGVGSPNPQ